MHVSWQSSCLQQSSGEELKEGFVTLFTHQTDSWLIHAAVGVHYHPSSHDPTVCVVDWNTWKCTQAWCCPWQHALCPAKPSPLSLPVPSAQSELSGGATAHFSLPLNAKRKRKNANVQKTHPFLNQMVNPPMLRLTSPLLFLHNGQNQILIILPQGGL